MCDNGARFRERRGAGTATCTHPVHLSRARRRSQAATTAQVTLWEQGRKMPRGAGTMRQKFISVTWAATCWHRGGRSYGWMDKQPGDLLNGEQQQPPVQEIPIAMAPRRSQRTRKPAISKDYEVYHSEEIQNEGDPTSFEEAIKNANSSKWFAAMKMK